MGVSTLAFVGATGGAGTTRLAVETAATLARDGRSVAVLDAAFATQGLATRVPAQIRGDLTAVATGEASLAEATYDADFGVPGQVALCPAHAPFERIARAKTSEHAQAFERAVAEAAGQYDHVLLDVPPVAANQALAAVDAAQRRALVVPATARGRDLLPQQRGRLRDVDAPADAVVATRTDAAEAVAVEDADHTVPAGDPNPTSPSALDPESTLAPAVADTTEALLDVELGLSFDSGGLL
ncbi:MinD/ParA family ATP-binding protein [Haloarcula halophila]|uniref:MinD/ParA family ATP-binding protein n=1 Tax=Haloarcula TaxID=2237 RepID=UPI0023E3B54F|nr:ParA family protein [Halomicroarcula sp. DFY41]